MALAQGPLCRLAVLELWRCGAAVQRFATSPVGRRKPRWMPTAPSKVYRVPKRSGMTEQERDERKELYATYWATTAALRRYLQEDWEQRQSSRARPGHVLSPEQEEAEHRQLMEFNRAENARMAAERETRLAQQADEIRHKVERLQQQALQQQEQDYQHAVQLIRSQEEISKMYIARDKLEEAIETALANETDYNHAIDKDGARYEGRLTKPS